MAEVRRAVDGIDHPSHRPGRGIGAATAQLAASRGYAVAVNYVANASAASAVVQAMAGLSSGPVNTCSIAFDDPAFNESVFAKMVADRYRTNHFLERSESVV